MNETYRGLHWALRSRTGNLACYVNLAGGVGVPCLYRTRALARRAARANATNHAAVRVCVTVEEVR